MKDRPDRLSHLTITFHWLIALGVIVMLALGTWMGDLPRSPEKADLVNLHKSIGVAILALAALRVAWRWRNGFPVPLPSIKRWEHAISRTVHWGLILGTILMPVSGLMMSIGGGHPVPFFGFTLVGEMAAANETVGRIGGALHSPIAWVLIVLITLHVLAALKHHLVDRDGTLRRMLGRRVEA